MLLLGWGRVLWRWNVCNQCACLLHHFVCVKGKGYRVCHVQKLGGLCGYRCVVLIELDV